MLPSDCRYPAKRMTCTTTAQAGELELLLCVCNSTIILPIDAAVNAFLAQPSDGRMQRAVTGHQAKLYAIARGSTGNQCSFLLLSHHDALHRRLHHQHEKRDKSAPT